MASQKSKVDLKRVNINLPINLVKRVEEYGESIGVNTTAAYIFLLNQALNQNAQVNSLPMLQQFFSALQNTNNKNNDNPFKDIVNDSNKMASLLENLNIED